MKIKDSCLVFLESVRHATGGLILFACGQKDKFAIGDQAPSPTMTFKFAANIILTVNVTSISQQLS